MFDDQRSDRDRSMTDGESRRHQQGRARGSRVDVPVQRRDAHGDGAPAEKDIRRQLDSLEEALEEARKERVEANDNYLRLAAELDNLRKRHRQEQADQLQYGNAELITRLLPVLDNFHRALEHAPEATGGETPQEWVAGLTMVLKQLEDLLAAEGVHPIDAVGQEFDPNLHQAVMAEPSDEHAEGTVTGEMQRGYMLRDRVLRPSMVKVARNN